MPVVHRGGPARRGVPVQRLTQRRAGGSCGPTGASRGGGDWGGGSGAILEAPAFVAGLDDVAVMRQAVEKRCGHLGVAEHLAMPPSLIGESLGSRWLTRIIRFMAAPFLSATGTRDADLS